MTDRGRICTASGVPDDRKSRQVQICLPGFLICFVRMFFYNCFTIYQLDQGKSRIILLFCISPNLFFPIRYPYIVEFDRKYKNPNGSKRI